MRLSLMVAVIVPVLWLIASSVSGQSSGPDGSCAELRTDPAKFHNCALARAGTFNPPRTPDGRPVLRGFWGRTLNSYDLEDHPASFMIRAQKRLIVDPAHALLPYQSWAVEQKKK